MKNNESLKENIQRTLDKYGGGSIGFTCLDDNPTKHERLNETQRRFLNAHRGGFFMIGDNHLVLVSNYIKPGGLIQDKFSKMYHSSPSSLYYFVNGSMWTPAKSETIYEAIRITDPDNFINFCCENAMKIINHRIDKRASKIIS